MCLVTELRWNDESHVACRKNARLLIAKNMPKKENMGHEHLVFSSLLMRKIDDVVLNSVMH